LYVPEESLNPELHNLQISFQEMAFKEQIMRFWCAFTTPSMAIAYVLSIHLTICLHSSQHCLCRPLTSAYSMNLNDIPNVYARHATAILQNVYLPFCRHPQVFRLVVPLRTPMSFVCGRVDLEGLILRAACWRKTESGLQILQVNGSNMVNVCWTVRSERDEMVNLA
jgi:hypothetical protein